MHLSPSDRLSAILHDNIPTVKSLALSAVFYCALAAGHRLVGGRKFLRLQETLLPLSLATRLALVGGASIFTHTCTPPLLNSILHEKIRVSERERVRRCALTVLSFALLEQVSRLGVSPLRTSLPSSIRATGSFASCFGSIPSFSAQATPYQRVLVQRLGRKFGCHHCGTRQLLSFGKSFIADHMPPTQIARLRNKALWRQLLNWPVQQVLRPQCESCCAIQGSAVRIGAHVAVYNLKPRLVILAPVLAVWLIENPYFGKSIKEHTNSMVDVCLDGYRGMKSLVDQPK